MEWDDNDAILLALMRLDAKLERLLVLLGEEDDGDEEDVDS
jgi:hypothetical protein